MTINDALSVAMAARWSEESLYLKEFLHKHKLPRVVRVVKGQYLNLGAPTAGPNSSLQQHLLLVNLGRRRRLLAQCVRFKENHKLAAVGQKLAIPAGYDGLFEILSEDGRCVKCIESVAELIARFPDSVLVREDVRAFVSKGDDIDAIRDKSRTILAGERLILVGEVLGVKGKVHSRFLRCFDAHGENVYLPHELRGRFSAIAKEDNISGVHSVCNLLNKRLPLMVRLAHGRPPPGMMANGNKVFFPEMRLLADLDEDLIVGLTLAKDPQVLSLPQAALIKVQTASNTEELNRMAAVARLMERCLDMSSPIMDEMTVHDISFSRDLRLNEGKMSYNNRPTGAKRNLKISLLSSSPMSKSAMNGDDYDEIEQIYDYVRGFAPLPRSAKGWRYETSNNNNNNNKEEEVDKPPEPPPIETIPPRPQRPTSMELSSPPVSAVFEEDLQQQQQMQQEQNKENKKRQRSRLLGENLYPTMTRFVKSASSNSGHYQQSQQQQRHRFFLRKNKADQMNHLSLSRGNLYSPMPPSLMENGSKTSTSPSSFFHLRYKSMTNLAYNSATAAEYDTLDSSNSGGKDSGGSRACTLPEKRSRSALSRPKSLTDLVCGLGGGNVSSNNNSSNNIMSSGKYSSVGSRVTPQPSLVSSTHNNQQQQQSVVGRRRQQQQQQQHQQQTIIMHHSNKLGTVASTKKVGTLYL